MDDDNEHFAEWLFYRRKSKHSTFAEYSTISHEKDNDD